MKKKKKQTVNGWVTYCRSNAPATFTTNDRITTKIQILFLRMIGHVFCPRLLANLWDCVSTTRRDNQALIG